ncbi:ATP12 family protein [Erythrobacter sp. F6033]|uniref:ATP12 family chaperone protein n=1 Tax=Erythrobacter sp. F6033 TaxID=2926401 RepID=UPI001FF3FF2B|nr:molecular chaperone [Erythrobacter sp. F6033]
MKRFYDNVAVQKADGGWQVTLDGRGLKTVKGVPQIVPTATLAEKLAAEWDIQGEKLDPAQFSLRDMTDYAIDVVGTDIAAQAQKITAFGDTDTLLYRADPDEHLYAKQQEVWEPIVAAFEAREGVELVRVSGIMHRPQSDEALGKLRARLEAMGRFELAALESMTSLAASLVIALSAADAGAEADAIELWRAASLEEEWQADLWGRDLEAEDRRAKRQSDFLKAWEFIRAARG